MSQTKLQEDNQQVTGADSKEPADYPGYFDILTIKKIFTWEVLGAFFLSIGATSCSYSSLNDVCIPNIVFWVNVLSGPYTGAHLNAMITMSWVFKSNRGFVLPTNFVMIYIFSQIFGAFLGGIALFFLHGQIRAPTINYIDQSWLRVDMATEAFIGALYCCICHIINKKSVTFVHCQYTTWFVASIGVFFARQYSIHSGGCMNPSLAIGLNIARALFEGTAKMNQYTYVYVVFPILGSLIGTLFFDYIYCRCLRKNTV